MSMNILGIGVGEGGGRLAMSMVAQGVNIGAINTNKGDLAGLTEITEDKKLLLNISAGGSGRDPNFVRESLKNDGVRESISLFLKQLINSTPLYSKCPHCNNKDHVLDTEAIGDSHNCSFCKKSFGLTEIAKNPGMKHDYIFLFVCLGGGSGSGLIMDVVDICIKNFQLPVGVVCTLPGDIEDMLTKNNAVAIFEELHNVYAKEGIVSPLILVDNQKMFENFNLPIGSMYPTINRSITGLLNQFNKFTDQTSGTGATMDTMNTGRLFALGKCCSIGKFIVGNPASKEDKYNIIVPHPLDLAELEEAIRGCTFVDGFDLASASGVGIIAVAPEYFFGDENVSTCVRYAFGKVKEIIGSDGLVFTSQLVDNTRDHLQFYLIFNGMNFPKERFDRMWAEIRQGKINMQKKADRVDDVPYDAKLETMQSGQAFKRLQQITGQDVPDKNVPNQVDVPFNKKPDVKKQPCNNCFTDPVTKKSVGVYRKGGPAPFTGKVCPQCQGKGVV